MPRSVLLMIVCCIAFGLASCATTDAAGKDGRVGYINLQRLVKESKMGQDAQKEMQKLRKEKEVSVVNKLREINKLKDLINNEGDKMSPSEKRVNLEALQKAGKEYKRLVADAKEDILREDRELVAVILKQADGVLKKVARQQNYTIILKDPNAIGYLDPSVDITDFVIKALNKQ
ncbi:OmpH family outer membrane protein [bacterium]|nr:OmpH family outer membrane protein [bacterium]